MAVSTSEPMSSLPGHCGTSCVDIPDASTTVQASLGCHFMALQCQQSQDIVKYIQVPIFSKSRTDLLCIYNFKQQQGTFAETETETHGFVLQGDAPGDSWALPVSGI